MTDSNTSTVASKDLRQALRALTLPTRVHQESACLNAFERQLEKLRIQPEDGLSWVHLQLDAWSLDGHPSVALVAVVKAVLAANAGASLAAGDIRVATSAKMAANYFDIHAKLVSDQLMAHREATAFLSYAFVICDLTEWHNLSAAQTVAFLSALPLFENYGRQAIECVLAKMQSSNAVSLSQMQVQFAQDEAQESAALTDADLAEAVETISIKARTLGLQSDLQDPLNLLMPTVSGDGKLHSPFTPYLQILHFQCCLAEFVDHDLADIYEFSPRGEKGEWLHKKYPDAIAGAGNPFLNNAKSVEVLDRGWARSKKPKERPGALALLAVLGGLKALNFLARRELAFWLRMWLHRIIRIGGQAPLLLPKRLTPSETARLLDSVAQGNTKTFGIVEQRVVDAIAASRHGRLRARGLGDSVNATNASKRKLGDCEFLDVQGKAIFAYEAHAGNLSQVYIEGHLAGLRKSLPPRRAELEAIAEISEWRVDIVFVAHGVADVAAQSQVVDGLRVSIKVISFAEFLKKSSLPPGADLTAAITKWVVSPLGNYRSPNKVRGRFLELIH